MDNKLAVLQGIHPGVILNRELQKRNLTKGKFAISINEYPQTLSAIANGKRDMNIALSLKIEQALGLQEGYLMILQVYHDIKKIKKRSEVLIKPDFSLIRPSLFWDTSIEKINWQQQKNAVIKRIFQRGNDLEKDVITKYYGKESIAIALDQSADKKQH